MDYLLYIGIKMSLFNKTIINIYLSPELQETLGILNKINLKLDNIMATITELTAKVDELQVALDAEQEQIRAAIEALNQAIADLQVLVAEGGTAEERQALADKLDAIKADLVATIPE